ncbi:M23 family metallopeptidase [Candidatus Kaiserbacteria bacterium]|nr:MAG: M23 family metallopeptidase [Candidatus Kaiserbacteria bacterium]
MSYCGLIRSGYSVYRGFATDAEPYSVQNGTGTLIRLILSTDQDSDPSLRSYVKVQMTKISTTMWRNAVFLVVVISMVFPTGVHAGFFSNVFAAFSPTLAYTAHATYNSQTIPLPRAAQNIDPNPSKGGGDITIVNDSALLPASGPAGSLADVDEGSSYKNNGQISIYIVRPGDTLGDIAQMFDVSINTIRWGNDIARSEAIQPGQELVILPVTGIKYTVKNGGTLKDIIDKYGGDIEEAVEYNGFSATEHLVAGTEVIIPDGELAAPKAAAKVAQSRYTTTTSRPRGTSNVPSYSGFYIRPINGGTKTQGIHGYNAVDLAAPAGTPILASAAGKVIISKGSGWNGGYGKYIVIEHANGTQTLYSHNSRNQVFSGQSVVQGQVIGYVGSTGRSTGSHVHFEIRGAKNPF